MSVLVINSAVCSHTGSPVANCSCGQHRKDSRQAAPVEGEHFLEREDREDLTANAELGAFLRGETPERQRATQQALNEAREHWEHSEPMDDPLGDPAFHTFLSKLTINREPYAEAEPDEAVENERRERGHQLRGEGRRR